MTRQKKTTAPVQQREPLRRQRASEVQVSGSKPADYANVLAEMTQRIAESRHRALQSVNRELVCLYLEIGRVIVQQQEAAHWGDVVVEQLSEDLRAAFPDMKGLLRNNLFRMRQFFLACREVDRWHCNMLKTTEHDCDSISRRNGPDSRKKVATARRQLQDPGDITKVATVWRQFQSPQLKSLVPSLSWSHHREITELAIQRRLQQLLDFTEPAEQQDDEDEVRS